MKEDLGSLYCTFSVVEYGFQYVYDSRVRTNLLSGTLKDWSILKRKSTQRTRLYHLDTVGYVQNNYTSNYRLIKYGIDWTIQLSEKLLQHRRYLSLTLEEPHPSRGLLTITRTTLLYRLSENNTSLTLSIPCLSFFTLSVF